MAPDDEHPDVVPSPPPIPDGDPRDSEGVTWIDASAAARTPPPGRAPRLLPQHAVPRRPPEPSPFSAIRRALVVPLIAGVVLSLLGALQGSSRVSLERAIAQARQAADRTPNETLARIARQRELASTLIALRRAQREAVNSRCESGDWCEERIAARDRSLRLAEDLLASAGAWQAVAPEPSWAQGMPPPWSLVPVPRHELLPAELGDLETERGLLAEGRVTTADDVPLSGHSELRRRLEIVEAEIRLVEAAQP